MGDYNINLLNFVTKTLFIPYITKPTRITSNPAALIDHIYSNHCHPYHESGIIITDIADYFATFHIIYGTPRPQISVYRQVRQLNQETLHPLEINYIWPISQLCYPQLM